MARGHGPSGTASILERSLLSWPAPELSREAPPDSSCAHPHVHLAGAGTGLCSQTLSEPAPRRPPTSRNLTPPRKTSAGTRNLRVTTFSVASHANSPAGRRHQLARAAAGDNRAAPTLLSQDPPLLLPAPGSPPTLCTNLAALAQPRFPRRTGSTGLGRFRVCAKRRGGAPGRAAPSAPASRPQCSQQCLPAHCPPPPVPSLWAKLTWSV